MFKRLKTWLEQRRLKRRWPPERQLENLLHTVQGDARWMGHDPKVAALTDRYLDLLAPDWYRRSGLDVSRFRDSIGCNPHRGATPHTPTRDELYARIDRYKEAAIEFFQPGPTEWEPMDYARIALRESVDQLYAALEHAQAQARAGA